MNGVAQWLSFLEPLVLLAATAAWRSARAAERRLYKLERRDAVQRVELAEARRRISALERRRIS